VYQTERYGSHTYTFGGLTPNTSYTVRLHFAELYFASAGSRRFNVAINGTQVLTNLDIFATVGANKALVRDFTSTASAGGQIVIQYLNVVENAKSSGIEILSQGSSANQPPTVANNASANPNPVTGTTSSLTVLGADDGGEANLTYTWATSGTPPAAVSFSSNGTNAAKNTTATFTASGSYTLVATIRDAAGASATSSLNVTVNPSGGGGTTILFDDFLGSSIDSSKWTVFDRISDQVNGEINCCVPSNVSVSAGILNGVSKFEDHTCGDSQQAPVTEHYTSWQIQQKTAPFLYGTVEVRAKLPGGIGIWPAVWMLGYQWQASQPYTANTPEHNWPHDGWCEIDIAEFWQNARTRVNTTVHYNTPGGLHEQALPFDATTRFMIYRLQWSAGSLVYSVDAQDGVGFRTLYTVTGADRVPNVPMYLVIHSAIGGIGGGTPDPATFPQTFSVDWVRITQ
jgi:beta-glucanase (GH16 family)